MSIQTEPVATVATADDCGEAIHSVCSRNQDIAWCGADVTDAPWMPDGTTECVVCLDILHVPTFCPLGVPCICPVVDE